jgi:hypothetical protein
MTVLAPISPIAASLRAGKRAAAVMSECHTEEERDRHDHALLLSYERIRLGFGKTQLFT